MMETCATCRHWFNAKVCRRYPEAIEKSADDSCGEWLQVGPDLRTMNDMPQVATGPTRTMVAAGKIDPGDMVKEVAPGVAEAVKAPKPATMANPLGILDVPIPGAAEAAARIDKAKKGGRR